MHGTPMLHTFVFCCIRTDGMCVNRTIQIRGINNMVTDYEELI